MNLKTEASMIKWWHGGIPLADDLITEGTTYPRYTVLPYLELPLDLTDKTAIDICTWDGYWSFELEKRNASKVIAVDSFVWNDDNAKAIGYSGKRGFNLAHKTLESKVIDHTCEVLDLSVDKFGTFDIVLFFGVLYHMRHPLLALEKAASLAHDLLILETEIEPNINNNIPLMRFYPDSALNNDSSNWFVPNMLCVEAMLKDVGFTHITGKNTFANSRAIFHAYR